jgi:RNA polymerase sigma-70 factor (ECF subfamily)
MVKASELAAINTDEKGDFALALSTEVILEDEQLLARLWAGERAAFEELVNKYNSTIYNLAVRLLGNTEDARDITQDVFLKVYNNIAYFQGKSSLRTWIYRITVNHIANQQRWWRRRWSWLNLSLDTPRRVNNEQTSVTIGERLVAMELTPEQQTLVNEKRRLLAIALGKLKFEFRTVVILRDIEGLSYEEIAETLEISVGTVKSRISRGREELREYLKTTLG